MAIFDPALQRLSIRIVYDGAGGAGKTTNVRAICNLFAAQHAVELYSPGEVEGRTLYFDWVQILAGTIMGFPLLCQVISVPGQSVLTPRRRHLLASADVIVLVCDSSVVGIERGQEALRLIDEVNPKAPLLFQANKQDQMHAIPGVELAERLGRPQTVVEAIATDGIGVIDTFLGAVRVLSQEMQERGEAAIGVGAAPGAAEMLAELERQKVDPEWAAEMFLEEAQSAILVSSNTYERGSSVRLRTIPGGGAVNLPNTRPVLPQASVETGFVWPAHSGRELLGRLETETEISVPLDGDGRALHHTDEHLFRTTNAERFVEREDARQALVKAARERTQLDPRELLQVTLVVQPARDGALWLWTLLPRLPSLAEVLRSGDGDSIALLEAYGTVAAEVIQTSIQHDFAVDLKPESFAVIGGMPVYVGEITRGAVRSREGLAKEALDMLIELGLPVEQFVEALDRQLRRLIQKRTETLRDSDSPAP